MYYQKKCKLWKTSRFYKKPIIFHHRFGKSKMSMQTSSSKKHVDKFSLLGPYSNWHIHYDPNDKERQCRYSKFPKVLYMVLPQKRDLINWDKFSSMFQCSADSLLSHLLFFSFLTFSPLFKKVMLCGLAIF